MTKLIIAGSRNLVIKPDDITANVLDFPGVEELLCGGARGPDRVGKLWAERLSIPVKMFLPDWSLGRRAGPLRNEQMAKYAGPDGSLLAFWDGDSTGTNDMVKRATAHGLRVLVITRRRGDEPHK